MSERRGGAMSLLYSDVEEELRGTVRRVLTDRAPWTAVLKRTESDEPYDQVLWRTLAAEVGVAALPVPETFDGAGASWREVAVVAEELGRAVAPVPYLGAATATAALLELEDDLLRAVAAGERTAVLAVPLSTGPTPTPPVSVRADGGTLTGTVTSVADALTADVLLVFADDALYAVDAAAVTRTPILSLDLTRRLADVTFEAAPARRLAAGEPARVAWERAWRAGAVLLAGEQLGIAGWCLETTVGYVKTRHQFGRPVGSFQALKHRLAELWVAVTQARAVARYAAGCLAGGDPDLAVAASLAQAHCGPVAVRAAEECVQLHGGIAMTWEHPAHLYLKRAKSDAIAFGTAERHRAALAGLVDISS
ncbi:acyl-CoA dehydrogenase family protein [Planosporangium sp. 12N6]|uniref:acyl-CoA dehydrogenase family protein n=1 Tax=Planosporangium spinosum TaxID=3402278 RepID=UPI003CE7A1C0